MIKIVFRYSTRDIITRSLYFFNPLFEEILFIFYLCSKILENFALMYDYCHSQITRIEVFCLGLYNVKPQTV